MRTSRRLKHAHNGVRFSRLALIEGKWRLRGDCQATAPRSGRTNAQVSGIAEVQQVVGQSIPRRGMESDRTR